MHFASYFQAQVTSLTPAKVNAGFNIVIGIGMLAAENPVGLFFIASGLAEFGRSNDWQTASDIFALAGGVASLPGGGFGVGGGGEMFGFSSEGGSGKGSIWGVWSLVDRIARLVYGEAHASEKEDLPPLVIVLVLLIIPVMPKPSESY
jgi:hypothetical protein